ncbi:MAG: hypothetical protein IAX21_06440 [Candidatus Bathyarchaeota archaeon]|nr:MAG: hypothetical protein IAX21_06440 [Candidatus Bathyarchaeota archaeon]
MPIWTCPNPNCQFDKELQPNQNCPSCGESADEFNFSEAGDLIKQKLAAKKQTQTAEQIKQVPNRIKYCPRCGSTKVFWGSGLPQLWSLWECKNCGYKGALILEDGKLGQKLREEWQKTVKS